MILASLLSSCIRTDCYFLISFFYKTELELQKNIFRVFHRVTETRIDVHENEKCCANKSWQASVCIELFASP